LINQHRRYTVAPKPAPKAEAPKAEEKSKVETVANSINDKLETAEKLIALIPAVRTQAPPSVRKFIEAHKDDTIVSATVCRKPIFSIIQKTINILRKITFQKANPTFDKLFHLYMYLQLKSPDGKISNIKIERNQTMELTQGTPDSSPKGSECKPVGKMV
jgi:hypothetical protein